MNRQGNNQIEYNNNNEQYHTHGTTVQFQQTQDQKDKQTGYRKNDIIKKLQPSVASKNPIDEIDEHNADIEIEKIKNKILNRNSEKKNSSQSPIKDDNITKKQKDKNEYNDQEIKEQNQQKHSKNAQKPNNKILKHPLYSSSDSDDEIQKQQLHKNNKKSNQSEKEKQAFDQFQEKSKHGYEQKSKEDNQNTNMKHAQLHHKQDSTGKQKIKNQKAEKGEDEDIKALESISKNKINFKENIKKLKQLYKNNFNVEKTNEEERQKNQNQQNQEQHYKNQQQSNQYNDQNQFYNENNNSENYSGQQQDTLFSATNPYPIHPEDLFNGQEAPSHIYHGSEEENIQSYERVPTQSKYGFNTNNSQREDSYYYYKQQYNLSGDEGEMDSEVFNISPDHNNTNLDNRLNTNHNDHHVVSSFNDNQSLQASFLENSIFQRSPRQIQSSNSNNILQNSNSKKTFALSLPVPTVQSVGTMQSLNNAGHHIPSVQYTNDKMNSQISSDGQQYLNTSNNLNSKKQQYQTQIQNNQMKVSQFHFDESYQQNNNSNLSYSQSMHDQSLIYQHDIRKNQGADSSLYQNQILVDTILPQIKEEDEKYQKIYDQDQVLQKLLQEKNTLEMELNKWESYLQDLDRQSSLNQR